MVKGFKWDTVRSMGVKSAQVEVEVWGELDWVRAIELPRQSSSRRMHKEMAEAIRCDIDSGINHVEPSFP